MEKLPTCKLCFKRKVKQQEWKSEDEKRVCFTCKMFVDTCQQMAQVLNDISFQRGIKRQVRIILEDCKLSKSEVKFLNIIEGKNKMVKIVNN